MSRRQRSLPKVAVITPYLRKDLDYLRQCHQSVLDQEEACWHVIVADGESIDEIDHWDAHHVVLPVRHHDIGSTPRLIGSFHAIGLGVEAVAFLDADNWYAPNHISGLLTALRAKNASFASSNRLLCRVDGTAMASCPITNPSRFIDTNCMLFGRGAFHLLHHWVLMPDYGHLIGDRIMLYHLRQSGVSHVHLDSPSVNYRCGKEGLYHLLGEAIPEGVSQRPDYERSFQRWIKDGFPPL
ncbi:glycosyltransferase [Synechococcus sp. CBW1004]|uniref:glycosyltransferase family 2 protein n=1 Tax=Synechococcus sp. CBW1004 TaxID=1353136 RepID=UPI0018CD5862|nr:glycosyltransferase [Synechococcus sp. CBW1004]QPN63163.1 glycosyltransferase [Synechococcus sp. CBW1004]